MNYHYYQNLRVILEYIYIYWYKIIIGFPHLDGKGEISPFCLKYIYISKYNSYLIQKNIHHKYITLFLYILI